MTVHTCRSIVCLRVAAPPSAQPHREPPSATRRAYQSRPRRSYLRPDPRLFFWRRWGQESIGAEQAYRPRRPSPESRGRKRQNTARLPAPALPSGPQQCRSHLCGATAWPRNRWPAGSRCSGRDRGAGRPGRAGNRGTVRAASFRHSVRALRRWARGGGGRTGHRMYSHDVAPATSGGAEPPAVSALPPRRATQAGWQAQTEAARVHGWRCRFVTP